MEFDFALKNWDEWRVFQGWSFGGDGVGWSVKRVDLLGDLKGENLIVKYLLMFGESGR